MTRDLLLLLTGFSLLVVQAAVGSVVDLGVLMPNPLVPMVMYLGMAPDVSLGRGAVLSFLLGLLMDSFCGNAMGLLTFVLVATFLVARGAGFRLLMRGRVSQVMITAAVALVGYASVVALRGIFRAPPPLEASNVRHVTLSIVASALSTGALAPFLFQVVRRIDALRRREDSTVVS
jgi:rod shape-determining protein MreD